MSILLLRSCQEHNKEIKQTIKNFGSRDMFVEELKGLNVQRVRNKQEFCVFVAKLYLYMKYIYY